MGAEASGGGADDAPDDVRVEHDEAGNRYVLLLEGREVGMAAYVRSRGAVVLTHTEVEPALERRGLGSILAAGALDDLRAAGEKVVPRCPFIAAFIRSHPEYADLVDGGRR